MSDVAAVFARPSVVAFGRALRRRWRRSQKVQGKWEIERNLDYAALADLENAQTAEQLAETIKAFLRRFVAYSDRFAREHPEGPRPLPPAEADLLDLMAAVAEFADEREGVAVVRAALIAHALVRSDKRDDDETRGEDDE